MSRVARWLAHLVASLLDLFAAISGAYYSAKYRAIIRRLRLPPATGARDRGFVAVQIDGLAREHLTAAMDMGYAPYLQRLLRRGELVLRSWPAGLPCNTPAVQAGIFYGNNDDIPAFRWYDKRSGESIVCRMPGTMHAIQERVSAGRQGILAGGSSFANMFDGDASLSMFTVGAMNHKRFFESVRGLGFLLLFTLNPFRSLKMVVLSLWEYLVELAQHGSALVRRRNPRPLAGTFPLMRIAANVVLREIQTFAVLVEIYRGVPAIYTTYYGYDELAHHYGPLSKVPLRALRAIDARIRQIDSLRRLSLTRKYDLFILSDHGMTPAVPFRHIYGQTLGEMVRDRLGQEARLHERVGSPDPGTTPALLLLDDLEALESTAGKRLGLLARHLRRLVEERLARQDEEALPRDPGASYDLSRHTDLVVRPSGSLAHVYLNISPQQLDVSAIAALYPGLIGELAAHPGIWLVVGREGENVVVMARNGVLTLGPRPHLEGRDPLAAHDDPERAARQLARLARFPSSGDLILFGACDEAGTVVCFEPQWACHGGLGGPQERALLLSEPDLGWHGAAITQPTDLYRLFAERYLQPAIPPLGAAPSMMTATPIQEPDKSADML